MSGTYFDMFNFYVCKKCLSFDIASAAELNYNRPTCRNCGAREFEPNYLFIEESKKMKEDKIIQLDALGEAIKKKRECLMKKFGHSQIEYERNLKLNNILYGNNN